MHIQAAIRFVEENGNEVEKARLRFLFNGERPSQATVAQLLAGQREDGGWAPSWAAEYSSLDATCYRLAQAEALGVGSVAPEVARAMRFLISRQASNGTWEEDRSMEAEAPDWVKPGDPAARLYLTANCGFWLAALSSPERTPDRPDAAFESAMRAGKALLTVQDDEGRVPGFLHSSWLAAAIWYLLGFNIAADTALDYLAGHISDLDAGSLGWMIVCLQEAGVPDDEAPYEESVDRLESLQAEDGRWSSEDGPGFDVHTTLEALRALKFLGRY